MNFTEGQPQINTQSSEGNNSSLYVWILCLAANMCNFVLFVHFSIIINTFWVDPNSDGQSAIALKSLGWMTLEERRAQLKAKLMFKTVNGLASQRLCDIFKNVDEIHNYNLRGSATKLYIPKPKTEFLKNSFGYSGAKLWNQIPEEIRNLGSLKSFCNKLSSSTSILVST